MCEDVKLSLQCACAWHLTLTSALVELYDETNGGEWKHNKNWLNGDPCVDVWAGVACDGHPPTVTELYDFCFRIQCNI